MQSTRMKLRVRRRDPAPDPGGGGPAEEGGRSRERRRSSRRKAWANPRAAPPAGPQAPPSPDSTCPICLDRFSEPALLDRCLHRFCSGCIQEWRRSKAECPLCKQPFASILRSARGGARQDALSPAPAAVAVVAAVAARGDRRMRLTLRRHRASEETAARRRRRRGRGGEAGLWEWYLDAPPPAPEAEEQEEERGVIFEGLMGLEPERAARRLQREGGAARRPREALALRRSVYRCGLRVRGVAGVEGGRGQRDITAEGFRLNPGHLGRLRPWLRRELTALYGGHASLVDVVQRIIAARLARQGLEDTPTMGAELQPFLLAHTDHFLHELVGFARSPLNMAAYDLQAAYEPPAAEEAGPDGSDGSSVIAISEGEEGRGSSEEAPGPSHCSPEPTNEEAEEECLIVGYKKPIAERTPELVQLSSDTEGEGPREESTVLAPAPPPSTSDAPRGDVEQSGVERSGSLVCSLSLEAEPLDEDTPPTDSRRKQRRKELRRRGGVLGNPALTPSRSDSGSPDYPPTSSVSSHCSSSPPPLPRTPPTPSAEKPGGKRKYKSRHLDGGAAWRPGRGRSRERGGGDGKCRGERSPSVEIVYEGTAAVHAGVHARRRRRRCSSPPVIITLDSDSCHGDGLSGSSTPLSSQQTVDFSDAAAVGGALEVGELPAHILDSDSEAGPIALHSDDSEVGGGPEAGPAGPLDGVLGDLHRSPCPPPSHAIPSITTLRRHFPASSAETPPDRGPAAGPVDRLGWFPEGSGPADPPGSSQVCPAGPLAPAGPCPPRAATPGRVLRGQPRVCLPQR